MKKSILALGFILTVGLITVATIGVSWWLQLWDGYPRGADAVSHLFRVNQILEFWPHFWWFHSWSGGTPHFLWYPISSYLIIAATKALTPFSLEFLASFFGVVSVAGAAVGVYLLTYQLTRIYSLSLAGSIIYSITPAVWAADFSLGGYSRGVSIAFLGLALWACVWWLKTKNRLAYLLTVIFLSLSLISHYNGGPQAFFAIAIILLFGLSLHERISGIIKVLIPAGLLSAVFALPLVLMRSPSVSLVAGHTSFRFEDMFLPWSSLFYLFTNINIRGDSSGLYTLTPLLLPLLVLGTLVVMLFRRQELVKDRFLLKIFLALGSLSLLFIIYGTVYFPFLKHYGSGLFDPRMAVFFLPSFLTPMVVLPFYWLFSGKLAKEASGLFLIGLAVAWFFIQLPPAGWPRVQVANVLELHLPSLPSEIEFNFRYGTGNYSNLAAPFNYLYPYVPQTRDYFATGVVVPDYYIYLVLAGWRWEDNYPETNFLFDWWGVRQFAVMNSEEGVKFDLPGKFRQQPDYYSLLGKNEPFSVFEFRQASPVTFATDVDPILIIGAQKTKAYNLIFRSLAQSDIDSKYAIPIFGKEYIDEYGIDEIKQFPALLLYDYKFRDAQKAGLLLKEYVESGGGLIIEANKASESVKEILAKLAPWPVSGTQKTDFGKDWHLTTSGYHKGIVADINFTQFAPAVFDGGPWGVTYASDIKEWAKPVLFDGGKPVMVAGDFGQGKVVWSGVNLPYHIVTYKSQEESRLLGQMIAWVQKKEKLEPETPPVYTQSQSRPKSLFFETDKYKVEFVHPEKRVITLKEPAGGILFKEAWFPNWQARVNGTKVRIYKAGPDFMYVPLNNSRAGDEVVFVFGTHPVQWAGRIISLGTLVFLLLWLFDWWVFKPYLARLKESLTASSRRFTGWWEKEEV